MLSIRQLNLIALYARYRIYHASMYVMFKLLSGNLMHPVEVDDEVSLFIRADYYNIQYDASCNNYPLEGHHVSLSLRLLYQ